MGTSMLTGETEATHQRRLRAALFELALVAFLFALYRSGRSLSNDSIDRAFQNAAHVIRLEQAIGVFNERHVQDWILGSRALVGLLNRYYVTVHFPITIAFLVWAYVFHLRAYRFIRTWFAIVTLIALAIHVGFPLAPPRMTSGFVDTLQQYGPRIYAADPRASVANQFAAMPSLHFGWALMLAVSVIAIRRTRRSLLILLHPFITLVAIVGTGNHFWFDAAVAMLLAGVVGLVLLARLPRRQRAALPPRFEHAVEHAFEHLGPLHGPPRPGRAAHAHRGEAFGHGSPVDAVSGVP